MRNNLPDLLLEFGCYCVLAEVQLLDSLQLSHQQNSSLLAYAIVIYIKIAYTDPQES